MHSNYTKTINLYKKGCKRIAYASFNSDDTAQNKTFEEFCEGMDNIISANNSGSHTKIPTDNEITESIKNR